MRYRLADTLCHHALIRSGGVFDVNDETGVQLNLGFDELLVVITEYNGGWALERALSY